MMLAVLAMTLSPPHIPAECPQPILSYQSADGSREPTFGCFISKDSVCTHGKDVAHVLVTPLSHDGAEQDVYDVIENLEPPSANDYWVCDGQSVMPLTVYSAYKNNDSILLYRTNGDCLRIHRGQRVNLVKDYIDRVCQSAAFAGDSD